MTIEDRIRAYVTRSAGLDGPPGDDEPLVGSGYIVSVRMLDLVAFLEEEFGIRLRPIDLVPEKLATIGRMAATVRLRGG
ncbi:MAG: acyl carrier protein [Kofleriaceae bacterium]